VPANIGILDYGLGGLEMDLVTRFFEKCKEEPLRPKVLLARSYAQGHQLLEQICKRHGAIFNVDIQTLRGIVITKAKLELFSGKIQLLDEGQTFWIVRHLMKQLAEGNKASYISEAMLKPGIVDKVHRAVTEMRLAGIHSGKISADLFTNPDKSEYLQQLLSLYEVYLREHRQTDFSGLADFLKPVTDDTLYLTIEPTGWSSIECQMIDKLAGDRVYKLESDPAFYNDEHFAGNTFTLFRATGSLAEVREGFRRMLSEPSALDRTEIILSDYERYAPVIHSQAEALGFVYTLSNGLPLVFCSVGRAAVGILDWIEQGFPVTKLTELLRHGDMTFPDGRGSQGEWIRLLEQSGIGWGRERYLTLLKSERLSEENTEPGAALFRHIEKWFDSLSVNYNEWSPIRLLEWVSDFVANYAVVRSPDDGVVSAALLELATRHSSSPSELMPMDMAKRYVREILGGIRIRVSATPKSGAVHVSSLQNGGWSGRDRTWIMGMDERAWRISTVQDPLLLDEERTGLSEDLEPMGERAKRIRHERESRLSLIRGEVWLSYSSYDPEDQKSQRSAFEMLQVLRLQSGDSAKDFGALEHALGEPYGVMDVMHPLESRSPIDRSDVWARWLLDASGRRIDGWQAMLQTYPDLAQGYQARVFRQEENLSAYDGWLNLAPPTYNADSGEGINSDYISVSQLEQYASCGLKYYFQYVLKLRPKETAEFDRTRWLQANERGILLHDVFRRYLENATDHGTRLAMHSRSLLSEITDKVIEENAIAVPPPNSHVFAKECEEIRLDAEIFYRKELGKTDQPIYFELELMTQDGEPMEIELSGGIRFKLKGFVDRVDRIGPHEYRIIDYKTGSPSKYKPSEYFCGGTQLQHALYSIAVEKWFRETGIDPKARVVDAEYYFPTERGRGEYVRRIQNKRDELAFLVARLLESRDSGIYVPAKDSNTCRYCDYQWGCGSHAEWMAGKREEPVNTMLSTLLEVEGIG
jgi:ATP-dependent helicase/nuclease subunit B